MKKFIYIILAIALGISIGFFIQPLISGDSVFSELKKFNYILNTTNKNYVDKVDTHKLVESAIRGMLKDLDPHSVYISAKDMKSVKEDFNASFDGIGVEFDIINDTIIIVSPIPGGPSESLGIMAGDRIVNIDGKNAIGLLRSDVPKKLKGPKGTHVKVDIKREGFKDLLSYDIKRDKIPIFTVDASFLIDSTDIGVVVVNRFAATTFEETVKAIRKLKNKGMKKLIIDLRGNPGGYLSQAYYIADSFIEGGDTIVYTRGRKPEFSEAFTSTPDGEFEDIPLIVLVSAGSASASEILSGAIQDLDRGMIVGTTTFGKGLVQRQYETGDGSAFRLTTSRYYTPSGRSIQRSYKDKNKYRHLFGRAFLKDGAYINNSLEKIKEGLKADIPQDNELNLDSLPIYHTRNGRLVLGSGGITPDYIVHMDTLTSFGVDIKIKNLFTEFVNDYVDVIKIKKKYAKNFKDYLRNFHIDKPIIDKFKKLAIKKGVKWDDKLFLVDKDYIKTAIKASIARSVWNRSRFLQVFFTLDNQLKKASTLFPDLKYITKK